MVPPLAPITVTVYVPAGVATFVAMVRTEVPIPPAVKVTGLVPKVKVRPVTGVAVDPARVMLPVKPRLPRVIVEVVEPPARKLVGEGASAVMSKSGIVGIVTLMDT